MQGQGPPSISVAELGRRLRQAAEQASTGQWVEAELGAVKPASSGHVYFTLKDEREEAMVEAVMYRSSAQRVAQFLFSGSKVQVWGKATVWVPRGRLQFVVDRLRPAGRGALLEALEQLRQKLLREGLFHPDRKRPLPARPKVVGVVTSAHGAAWHDIVKVAQRRAAVRLILAPAVVQGEEAPHSIVSALRAISRVPDVDVVIVGRGGGSLEDLMAFSDERVVRAVAAMPCPVVSAVGHEIDVSLCDLAADLRAATPSEAAERVVPDERELKRRLSEFGMRLVRSMRSRILEDRQVLHQIRARLSDPRFLVAEKQQYKDEWAVRLERIAHSLTKARRAKVVAIERRLNQCHPRVVLAREGGKVVPLAHRLNALMNKQLRSRQSVLAVLAARLNALSPVAVLGRGYAIVLATKSGAAVRASSDVQGGDSLHVVLHQGRIDAVVVDKPA